MGQHFFEVFMFRIALFLTLGFLFFGHPSVLHSQQNEEANLLFHDAIDTYEMATAAEGAERDDLLRKVGEMLDRIQRDYPDSIPSQFMEEGRPLGPIDLDVVATAQAAHYTPASSNSALSDPDMPEEGAASVYAVAKMICEVGSDSCIEIISEVMAEFMLEKVFEETSDQLAKETVRWVLSNPGRLGSDVARLDAFGAMIKDDAFFDGLMARIKEGLADDWPARLGKEMLEEVGPEIVREFAKSLVLGLTTEALARYYESQGEPEAAKFARTWFTPIGEASYIAVTAKAAGVAGTGAGAAVIWAQNAYAFVQLGKRQAAAEAAGATPDEKRKRIATEIDSITRSLITRRLTGPMFAAEDQGTVVTDRMAAALERNLADLYDLQVFWLSSDDAVLLDTFDFVLSAARETYRLLNTPTQSSGTEHANSTHALPADMEGSGDFDGAAGSLTNSSQASSGMIGPSATKIQAGWSLQDAPNHRLAAGGAAWGIEVDGAGNVRFAEKTIFSAAGQLPTTVDIFVSPNGRAVLLILNQGDQEGVEGAVLDLGNGKILASSLTGLANGGAPGDTRLATTVAWSANNRFALAAHSERNWHLSAKLIEISSGRHVNLEPENAGSPWLEVDLTTLRQTSEEMHEITFAIHVCGDGNCDTREEWKRETLSFSTRDLFESEPLLPKSPVVGLGRVVGDAPASRTISSESGCKLQTRLLVTDFTWSGDCRSGVPTGAGTLTLYEGSLLAQRLSVGGGTEFRMHNGALHWIADLGLRYEPGEQFRFSTGSWAATFAHASPDYNYHFQPTVDRIMQEAFDDFRRTRGFTGANERVTGLAVQIMSSVSDKHAIMLMDQQGRWNGQGWSYQNSSRDAFEAERAKFNRQIEADRQQRAKENAVTSIRREFEGRRSEYKQAADSLMTEGEGDLSALAAALEMDSIRAVKRLEQVLRLSIPASDKFSTIQRDGQRAYRVSYKVPSPFSTLEREERNRLMKVDFSWDKWLEQTSSVGSGKSTRVNCYFSSLSKIPQAETVVEVQLSSFSSSDRTYNLDLNCD